MLPDAEIRRKYFSAGVAFGDIINYFCSCSIWGFPQNGNFERFFREWEKFESEYSKIGYKTISLDVFRDFQKRKRVFECAPEKRNGEEAVLHAQRLKEKFGPNLEKMIEEFSQA